MKYNQIMFLVIALLISITSVYSGSLTEANGYYSFDDGTAGDISGNNINGTLSGTTSGEGILGLGMNFTASSNEIDYGDNFDVDTMNNIVSISMWVKLTGSTGYIVSKGSSGQWSYEIPIVGGGELIPTQHQSSGSTYRSFTTSGGTLDDGDWHHLYIYMSDSEAEIWQDGVSIGSSTSSGGSWNKNTASPFQLGARSNTVTQGFVGLQDEVALYDFKLSADNISALYNSGMGFNPYIPVPSITFTNVTLNNNQNFNNTYYNVTPVNLEVNLSYENTDDDIDVTFKLYNSTEDLINTTTFITGTTNGSLDIVFPYADTFKFWLFAENDDTNTSNPLIGNYTVYYDFTPPSLTVNLPDNYSSYDNFDFSQYINFSDVNLATCVVDIVNQTSTTCDNTSYSFQLNGNASIDVTVTDFAGNVNRSLNNIMLVNPPQCHNFFNVNGSGITDYTFGGTFFSSNPACFDTYGDGLQIGSNTLLFEKLGYASTNVTFELNRTSDLNVNINSTQSQLIVTIFDRATATRLTGLTEVTLVGSTGFSGNTTTGQINISNINFINEAYQLIAEHADYATETVFFNYNNQENLPVDVYMLSLNDTNFGILTVRTVTSNSELIPNAQCDLQEWRPADSAFISVAQGLTDTQGEFTFNVELDVKVYKVLCSKGGVTSSSLPTEGGIISIDGTVFPIIMDDPDNFVESRLKNFAYSFTNSTENSSHQRLIYTFSDDDNLVSEACINIFHGNGLSKELDSTTCASGASGEIQVIVGINNTFDLSAQATVETSDGVIENLKELIFLGTGAFENLFKRYNLDIIIPLMLMIGFIALGLNMEPQNIYISVVGAGLSGWFSYVLFPSVITLGIAVSISAVCILLLLWGATR